ncbi:hypothetical protein MAPG_05384 [Magnaporthiopsis poae ATCC 64411]|uniref:Uncharacterized protein n=1 Tax=Magnaporthiopsis poae (strain ATCC 64411 / 73-15) TaxID=644358 RepID=A0A0C4DZ91_MAGP6|nr:hypothetical protein MAPG_05384 [Magnaporthiopsis poae ATCC 64411]
MLTTCRGGTQPRCAASGAEEFDPRLLTGWYSGLEAWKGAANEGPTTTPAQAPQPQGQGLCGQSIEPDLFISVQTGTHHGKCTPGRHPAGCTARKAACAAVVDARPAVQTTLTSRDYLERNGLRWAPALDQHGGPGCTSLVVTRGRGSSHEPCQIVALVVDNLAPEVDMLLCQKDAVRVGYAPALQYDEHTVAPLGNHASTDHGSSCGCCMDSMPVDIRGLPPAPYPRPIPPAPPAMGSQPFNGSGVMSTTGSLGDPTIPAGDLPLDYPPPPSASGSGTNFVAAAVDPFTGYGDTSGKELTDEELWNWINGGGDDNHNHNHREHEEPRAL